MRQLIIFFATGAYSGFSPIAPGTAGSVVGLILIIAFCASAWTQAPIAFLIVFAAVFAISCWISGRAEEIFQERDAPQIVIDEVLGMIATMYLNPVGWPWLAAGFILFRIADIVKPFPAGWIDRNVPGGAAVMLDDLAVAIYSNIAIRIVAHLI